MLNMCNNSTQWFCLDCSQKEKILFIKLFCSWTANRPGKGVLFSYVVSVKIYPISIPWYFHWSNIFLGGTPVIGLWSLPGGGGTPVPCGGTSVLGGGTPVPYGGIPRYGYPTARTGLGYWEVLKPFIVKQRHGSQVRLRLYTASGR